MKSNCGSNSTCLPANITAGLFQRVYIHIREDAFAHFFLISSIFSYCSSLAYWLTQTDSSLSLSFIFSHSCLTYVTPRHNLLIVVHLIYVVLHMTCAYIYILCETSAISMISSLLISTYHIHSQLWTFTAHGTCL